MSIHAWRIVRATQAARAFAGDGSKKYGGRWNSAALAVVYTAGSVSLAILEMLVHLRSEELLSRYVLFEATFDETLVVPVDPNMLPRTWQCTPRPLVVRRVGNDWLAKGRSAVLRVPSAIVPTEWNYLLNPAHPDFGKIAIGPKTPIQFDPRLIKTST
ncbi:MAG: RES family NAD+ phosphorylase [Planctomycetota bacterium]